MNDLNLKEKQSEFSFKISKKKDSCFPLMRSGTITTPHGDIQTPAFIPVATRATIKGVSPEIMRSIGAQALLANAYHLRLRPGENILDSAGGLGKFMNWNGPTFTDSGGFQVMSLGVGFKKVVAMSVQENSTSGNLLSKKKQQLAFIDQDGVTFKSHLDGSSLRFTPEISLEVQHAIGADIMFAFDELTTLFHTRDYQIESLKTRTHPWSVRSLQAHAELTRKRADKPYQALFAVLQGANFEDLRRQTSQYLSNVEVEGLDFDGFGIGGALEKERLGDIISWCTTELNSAGAEDKPRHLLGISAVSDLFLGVENGVDTFDCVSPAREARNGALYTPSGRINVKNAKYRADFTPVYDQCDCYTCANYTKSYLAHLIKSGEMFGATLATIHNERFILRLVDDIRESIQTGNYQEFKADFFARAE
ncbi:MAG: tRNA guanosine(34) transglycosylase Tgt [Candidatus Ancillula sp.]|nr:tRNA guanosine(34) transglycosylase Tgt [Candidatus Ancillula sp.]